MAEGQFTGERAAYVYESDNGDQFVLQLDKTLATLAGTGLTAYTGQAEATPAPRRFKPRGVHWQGKIGDRQVRKFLICNATDGGTLYAKDTSAALTIDGVAGNTTGRRGEALTFVKAQTAAPAAGGTT